MARRVNFDPNLEFRSFEKARIFARSLKLKSKRDWADYLKGKFPGLPARPSDIPAAPQDFYRYWGWSGFPDFLGYSGRWKYRYFHDARSFAQSLQLSSVKEWQQYCQGKMTERGIKPGDIPAEPHLAYKNHGWISYPDFLGYGMVEHDGKLYEPFNKAKAFARSLGLKSVGQWNAYCDRADFCDLPPLPETVPRFPYIVYKHRGWKSWEDWLDWPRARQLTKFKDFVSTRHFARSLNLKNHKEWLRYCRGELIDLPSKPYDIPQAPDQVYKKRGWISWGNFLGTGNVSSALCKIRPFEEARAFARQLKLKNGYQWSDYCKGEMLELPPKPLDIPADPNHSYHSEWQGMGNWLGTGIIANQYKKFRNFNEARSFVHQLNLENVNQWRKYYKSGNKPDDIPTNPNIAYHSQDWISWGDWLGNNNIHYAKIRYLSYEKAQAFVRNLGIKSSGEWKRYVKGEMPNLPTKPLTIPSNLDKYFRGKGWVSWPHFLGTEKGKEK